MINKINLLTLKSVCKILNNKYPSLNLKLHTIRFWAKNFKAIKPYKIINKRKYYNLKTIDKIEKIIFLLKEKRYSILTAKNYFKRAKINLDAVYKDNINTHIEKTNFQFKVKLLNKKIKSLKSRWQKKVP